MANRWIVTASTDPWHNLALEERLFDTQESEGATLYLWQNQNTVVVGRNQNAWKECRVPLLESEGGRLARRSSGGGAVFHDLGNLNFTFVVARADYDVSRQLAVLQSAVRSFGVETVVSGRNDVTLRTNGAKFSGNAFRFAGTTALHHGTILMSADMEKLGRYLAPSKQKLASKGVDSVRARVCNLSAVADGVNVASMVNALREAFEQAYGGAKELSEDALGWDEIALLTERYASWEWRFGKTPRFDIALSNRFDWGELELLLTCSAGRVEQCTVFSDANDAALPERLSLALKNAPFGPEALAARVKLLGEETDAAVASEIEGWLAAQSF